MSFFDRWLWDPIRNAALTLATNTFLGFMANTRIGHLTIRLQDGTTYEYGQPLSEATMKATLHIKENAAFFWRVIARGDVGFSEAYMAGEIEIDNLTEFFAMMIENREVMNNLDVQYAWIGHFVDRVAHWTKDNSLSGSKSNIQAHYDLGNDMFKLFLDPSLMYSCAIYRSPTDTLEQAQRNKLHLVIAKANILPHHHVLEIGSGWGSFAIEAVRQTGCRVTTITLSKEQHDLAVERIREAGFSDRIEVKIIDYRLVKGQFDRIVSIEMLEAVGYAHFDEYFSSFERLLKPDGIAVVQVITMADQLEKAYRAQPDFINTYIFPGAEIPTLTALCLSMTRSSKLMVEHLENIGPHYPITLHQWHDTFISNSARIKALGYPEDFIRRFVYYFCYCEAGFATRTIHDLHLVLTRPRNKSMPMYYVPSALRTATGATSALALTASSSSSSSPSSSAPAPPMSIAAAKAPAVILPGTKAGKVEDDDAWEDITTATTTKPHLVDVGTIVDMRSPLTGVFIVAPPLLALLPQSTSSATTTVSSSSSTSTTTIVSPPAPTKATTVAAAAAAATTVATGTTTGAVRFRTG